VPVLACAIAAGVIGQAVFVPGPVLPVVPGTVVILLVAWGIGDARRDRRLYLDSVRARAERLDRERHVLARLAVTQERSRIARELHDVVAHHVSLMIVSAAAADRQLQRDPEAARGTLRELIATGRAAVIEMRRLLGVLRSDDQADQEADRQPQPTLAELDALITAFSGAGLTVRLTVRGPRRPLSAGVELTAFRILQESLTNVLRHAGTGTHARVTVTYQTHSLLLEVRDYGGAVPPAADPGETGHGMIGMRERVALLGGSLTAAPVPDGGFLVHAVLPLAEDTRTSGTQA
jgi:signal transduction histidine kinase